ncbi:hypothetical protein R3P38DRAFT_2857595 [Favolaschia claudopus]|uniref:Uncharacterized protein n=1 Tax=Favolaschia claudopus TaxID=2862362 RepID=A0AAW0DJ13_9AGAR
MLSFNSHFCLLANILLGAAVATATPFPFRRHLPLAIFGRSSSSSSSNQDALCHAYNLNLNATADGALLTRAVQVNQTVLECHYSDGDICSYARGVRGGSSTCPEISTASTERYVPQAEFNCNPQHLHKEKLIGSSVTSTAGNLACVYADATMCTYSQHTGSLSTSSGADTCPHSAVESPGSDCPVSTKSSNNSQSAVLSASDTTSSASDKPSAAMIALIVVNSVLVLLLLGLSAAWLKRWHSGAAKRNDSRYHSLRLGSEAAAKYKTDADEMPLTHGAPGRYRDAFDAKEIARGRKTEDDENMDFSG